MTSPEQTGTTEDAVEAPASVARLPRRGLPPGGGATAPDQGRVATLLRTRAARIGLFGGLLAISLALKLRGIGSDYWIDEGLSVGIGSHPVADIPGLMRQDGSPPLYYMLLHFWMQWFGTGEFATQMLSLLISLACIPAAFWAGLTLFGKRAAWAAAALAAVNPFLTYHSYEARMYTLIALLSLFAATAFVKAFVFRERRWLPVFSVLLALMLYTHNWSFFFAGATVVACVMLIRRADEPRPLLRDAVLGYGVVALVYLPWLPTLLFQTAHTGAPWSTRPSPYKLIFNGIVVAGGEAQAVAIALGAGAGVAALAHMRRRREHNAALALMVMTVGTILLAWLGSQIAPAWATRYLSVALGPLFLFAGAGLARAQRLGVAALAIVLFVSAIPTKVEKTSRRSEASVTATLSMYMRPGDLVISSHPERGPLLRHYLGPKYRYASLFGPVRDPQVMDWRDAMTRIRHVRVATQLEPMLRAIPLHGRLLFVRPIMADNNSWKAPWTHAVGKQSRHWARALAHDRRFKLISAAPFPYQRLTAGVRGAVYERVAR
jgi:hypothetical protein